MGRRAQQHAIQVRRQEKEQQPGHVPTLSDWLAFVESLTVDPAQTKGFSVPEVMAQAYTLDNDRLGILLINLRSTNEVVLQLNLDLRNYGFESGEYSVRLMSLDGVKELGKFKRNVTVCLSLSPRKVLLMECKRISRYLYSRRDD